MYVQDEIISNCIFKYISFAKENHHLERLFVTPTKRKMFLRGLTSIDVLSFLYSLRKVWLSGKESLKALVKKLLKWHITV